MKMILRRFAVWLLERSGSSVLIANFHCAECQKTVQIVADLIPILRGEAMFRDLEPPDRKDRHAYRH